jgi:hypothetical protein
MRERLDVKVRFAIHLGVEGTVAAEAVALSSEKLLGRDGKDELSMMPSRLSAAIATRKLGLIAS